MFLTVCNNTDLTKFVEHWFTSLTTRVKNVLQATESWAGSGNEATGLY